MNELQIINEQEVLGKNFKMYGTYEEPLFLAKDVAEWIGHTDTSTMIRNIDEDEKVTNIICTLGGNQECWFLTENGLYEVLMQSRKPIAKEFKKEVKKILKSIRKHGAYMTDDTMEKVLLNPDFGIKLLTELKTEREKSKSLEIANKQQEQLIGELKPKADYTDTILQSKALVNINQIAKDYGMSARTMNKLLSDRGVQYKQGKQWLLYRKYHNKGYTSSETVNITHSDGRPDVIMRTKWTQKGRLFIYELLKGDGIIPIIEKAFN